MLIEPLAIVALDVRGFWLAFDGGGGNGCEMFQPSGPFIIDRRRFATFGAVALLFPPTAQFTFVGHADHFERFDCCVGVCNLLPVRANIQIQLAIQLSAPRNLVQHTDMLVLNSPSSHGCYDYDGDGAYGNKTSHGTHVTHKQMMTMTTQTNADRYITNFGFDPFSTKIMRSTLFRLLGVFRT